jgi:hypothetical protein
MLKLVSNLAWEPDFEIKIILYLTSETDYEIKVILGKYLQITEMKNH